MERLGIMTGADLQERPLEWLRAHFGSNADYLHGAAQGQDHRPVQADRPIKSIGAERTFADDLVDPAALAQALSRVVEAAWVRIERHGVSGRTVTLKIRFADFRTLSRSRTVDAPVDLAALAASGSHLLQSFLPAEQGIRLIGITLSRIEPAHEDKPPVQPTLL